MTDRLPLAQHTKASLDQLYADLDRARTEARDYAEAESADAAAGSYAGRAEGVEAELESVRVRLGSTLACIRLLKIYAHVLDHEGQVGASDVARRLRSIVTGLDDQATSGDGPHVYLSTGCYHGDHAYCQAMTGLAGAKRPASCKKCGARCICPCHQQTEPPAHVGGNAEDCPACAGTNPDYPFICPGPDGTAVTEADDITGVWTPDPPIGCLTVGADPDPFGYEERERTGRNAGLTLTPAEETRLAQSGVDTPDCDCGHDGMGVSWHGDDCPWRCGLLDIRRERTPSQRPGLRYALTEAVMSARIRPEPGPVTTTLIQSGSGFHLKGGEAEPVAEAVLRVLLREWPWLRAEAEERAGLAAAIERVRGAAYVADEGDATDWQRGYRACSERVLLQLDGPKEQR